MNNNKRIKTIFFDLGNVLINFDHNLMWQKLSKICQTTEQNLQEIINKKNLWKNYEKGFISIETFISEIEETLSINISHESFITAASEIFFLNQDMGEILKNLHKNNYELFLISNTCDIHFNYIKKKFNIIPYFKKILLSYELHLAKPEKEMFYHALSLTSSKPTECLYIDDLVQHTDAAEGLGIACHVFKNVKNLKKVFLENGISI